MTQRRSILDRSDLYWPAPKLSGQASYGGVLRSVFLYSGATLLLSVGLALAIIMVLAMIGWEGSTAWAWLVVPIITFCVAACLWRWTSGRRDILVVIREAHKIEQKERNT